MSGNAVATITLAAPGSVQVTLTYTTTLDQWKDLSTKLSGLSGSASVALVTAINSLVAQTNTAFTA